MAYLLHIDTSGATGTAAISRDGLLIAQRTHTEQRDHASAINRMIEDVCSEAGITLPQLDAVVLCAGPGSYTGLRIGMATAKGLCYALDLPMILHDRLSLMAWQQRSTAVDFVCPILKARDKEYFFSIYDTEFRLLKEPVHSEETDILKIISSFPGKGQVIFPGDVDNQLFDPFPQLLKTPFQGLDIQNWSVLAYRDYQSQHYGNLAHSEPFYLKGVYLIK